MKARRKAAYIRQQQQHEERRENPSRDEWLLRRAINSLGLTVIEYEHRLETDDRWYWFDAAIDYKGQIVLLDILDVYEYSGRNKRQKEIEQEKKDLCKERDIPYLLMFPKTSMELAAEIDVFLRRIA